MQQKNIYFYYTKGKWKNLSLTTFVFITLKENEKNLSLTTNTWVTKV